MIFELFEQIREKLANAYGITISNGELTPSADSPVKDIQYYADQYNGIIHAAPAVFVEIDRLDFSQQTKQTRSTPIHITLHVVTEAASESDNNTPDEAFRAHEAIATKAQQALKDKTLLFEGGETRPLRVKGRQFYARYQGWMVTLLELETKG